MGVSAGCGVGVSAGCDVGVVFTPISRQILIVEGETGSGKTTQIPQYL